MRRLIALATVVVIAAAVIVVVAATSSGSSKKSASGAPSGASSSATSRSPSSNAAVAVRRSPLGRILVDARGRTLYLFEADKPGTSACSGACASIWPPLTAKGGPRAGGGLAAAKLGTIARAGGQRQVTYNGHPLYTYVADAKPGSTAGQALNQFGARWYVLTPAGSKIDNG